MDGDVTLGEVHRLLLRLDGKVDRFTETASLHQARLGALDVRADDVDRRLDVAEAKIEYIGRRSAFVAGGIAVLGLLAQLIPWPWRHP